MSSVVLFLHKLLRAMFLLLFKLYIPQFLIENFGGVVRQSYRTIFVTQMALRLHGLWFFQFCEQYFKLIV